MVSPTAQRQVQKCSNAYFEDFVSLLVRPWVDCRAQHPFVAPLQSPCTLRDLCPEDKQKVAKLVKQVVELSQENARLKETANKVCRQLRFFDSAAASAPSRRECKFNIALTAAVPTPHRHPPRLKTRLGRFRRQTSRLSRKTAA